MAHNLDIVNSVASMMYVGERPWHGLGQQLDHPATSVEAIEAAHLGWAVELYPVRAILPAAVDAERVLQTSLMDVPNRRATVRTDTCAALGVVSDQYKVIQNREAFAFMDAVGGENKPEYHTAGALDSGRIVWLLCKLPGVIRIGEKDDVEKFICLVNHHDGAGSLRAWWTPTRVVCQNTLRMALRDQRHGDTVSVMHKGNVHKMVAEAQRVLGLAAQLYDDLEGMMQQMSRHTLTQSQDKTSRHSLTGYIRDVFPVSERDFNLLQEDGRIAYEKALAGQSEKLASVNILAYGRKNQMAGSAGTLWGAYNAVVEFVDHVQNPTAAHNFSKHPWTQERSERRLQNIWWGAGAETKARAWQCAVNLLA